MIKVNVFGDFSLLTDKYNLKSVHSACLVMDKAFLFNENHVVASLQDGAQ